MKDFKCKICGHPSHGKVYSVKEMMFGSGEMFQYVSCENCHTVQLVSPPQDIAYYYPEEYYAYSKISYSNLQVQWLKTLRLKFYRWFTFDFLKPVYAEWLLHLHAGENEKIADIGCGNGQLLYELYASGYKNLVGYDPFIENNVALTKGISLYKKDLEDIDDTFDIIMLHHAFEHMEAPSEAFAQLVAKLNPGGRILIRVPVTDGEAWKIYKEHWVQLDAPRHHFVPSVQAMEILAARHQLELYQVNFDSTAFQFWASELYSRGIPFYEDTAKSLLPDGALENYKKRALILNKQGKGDQACFYFRKTESHL